MKIPFDKKQLIKEVFSTLSREKDNNTLLDLLALSYGPFSLLLGKDS